MSAAEEEDGALEDARGPVYYALAAERGREPDDPALVAEADRLCDLYVEWFAKPKLGLSVRARLERYALNG